MPNGDFFPFILSSVEGEAPSSETGTSLDSPSTYHQGPITHSSSISPDHYDHSAYGLYSVSPGQQRSRRHKLQHSTSILRKQAEEEAIKRSRSLSESYELSSDLQDKQVFHLCCSVYEYGKGSYLYGRKNALDELRCAAEMTDFYFLTPS